MAGPFLSMGKQINYARLQDAVGTKENYVCYRIPLGRKGIMPACRRLWEPRKFCPATEVQDIVYK
jgi:hypothetical protein